MKLSHALMRSAKKNPPDFLQYLGNEANAVHIGGSSYTAPLPPHQAGDLLVVFIQFTGGGTIQGSSDWSLQGTQNYPSEGNRCSVFTKIAESSSEEFLATLSTSSTRPKLSVALAFRSQTGRVPQFALLYSAYGETSFPEVTPSAGLQKYTWLPCFAGKRHNNSVNTPTMPTGYSNIRTASAGVTNLYGRLVVGLKSTHATSETPGTMIATGGSDYHVTHIAAVWEED